MVRAIMVRAILRIRTLINARGVLAVIITFLLTACVSLTGGTGSTAADGGGSTRPTEEPRRDHFFDTPEHTVMDTPWFTVSSVILEIQRTQPETVIVVPADSQMRRYLALSRFSDTPTTTIPGNRFLFSLGIMTDGVPAFAPDPDRYRYPDLYE